MQYAHCSCLPGFPVAWGCDAWLALLKLDLSSWVAQTSRHWKQSRWAAQTEEEGSPECRPLFQQACTEQLLLAARENIFWEPASCWIVFIIIIFFFSCPEQLNRWPCPLVACSVCLTKLTIRAFTRLQSEPRDLSPLRHLIRGMRRHYNQPENLPIYLRGAFKSNFWKNLGIWPNQVDPPPPQKSGRPKLKKKIICLFCILGYSEHFIFSWKFSFFLVGMTK